MQKLKTGIIYTIHLLQDERDTNPLCRCEDYAISLLEQCEDLREVETFIQTRNSGNKDSNYILAILDSRMKFVAHERFQYVMLKKFGKVNLIIQFSKDLPHIFSQHCSYDIDPIPQRQTSVNFKKIHEIKHSSWHVHIHIE